MLTKHDIEKFFSHMASLKMLLYNTGMQGIENM